MAHTSYFRCGLVLSLAFGGIAFNRTYLAAGVSVADLLFGLSVGFAVAFMVISGQRLRLPRWARAALMLVLYTLVLCLVLVLADSPYVQPVEFVKSFSRLVFYALGAIILSTFLSKVERRTWTKVLTWLLFANSVIAIYAFAVLTTGIGLPVEFLWTGQDSPLSASLFRGVGLIRARGLFSEPSYFAIVQCLGLAVVMTHSPTRVSRSQIAVVIISIFLTFSLTAAALLGVVLAIQTLATPDGRLRPTRRSIGAAVGAVVLTGGFLALPQTRSALTVTLVGRLQELVAGADVSGGARLLGSLDAAALTVREAPLTGFGMSGLGEALAAHSNELTLGAMMLEQGVESWNILVYVLGSMGFGGLLVLAYFLWTLWRHNRGSAVLIVSTFASGAFLGPIFWVPVALLGAHRAAPNPVSPDLEGGGAAPA